VVDGGLMKKICASCGIIFEVKDDSKFCSEKCKHKFKQSNLTFIKRPTQPRKNYIES